ncbi:MAG: hypothetical protein AABW65_03740 [Nanoarchaeota archaeon]
MSFKEFTSELNGKRVEGELIKTFFYSIITAFITIIVLYLIKLKDVENFIPKYGLVILLSSLSYAIISLTIRQVRAYKELPCMAGMMVGMTVGMISGFLPGFYIASTNGMFIGSVWGMTIGIIFGIWNGKCCGIMGIMEGTMAGFMGGLMGAMTAFMLLNDNLKIASIIIFIISSFIIFSLNYMIYKEMRESRTQSEEDNFITIFITFILTIITTWIIVYGPRSGVFS